MKAVFACALLLLGVGSCVPQSAGADDAPGRLTYAASLVPVGAGIMTVRSGLTTAWRLAALPTSRSPVLVKPTTLGVVRAPCVRPLSFGGVNVAVAYYITCAYCYQPS